MDPRLVVGEGVLTGPSDLRVRFAAGTDPGRVRERNEDACGAFVPSDDLPLPVDAALVVSDGVGGHEGGEEASRFTVDAVRDTLSSLDDVAEPAPLLDALLHGIHRELLAQADERGMRGGMGATITLALLLGDRLFLAQVGDSRGYRLRDGVLTQLTRDDSWVAERERAAPGAGEPAEGTFGKNVLTQCLGIGGSLRVQVVPVTALPGDRYLLCSDGLHGPVPDAEIQHVLSRVAEPGEAVETLLERANAAGGPDNIAAVVFDVGPPFPAEARPSRGPAGTLPEGIPAGAGTTLPGAVAAPLLASPGVERPAPAGAPPRPSRRAGSVLVGVGALLLVAASAAGYRVSRADGSPGTVAPAVTVPDVRPGAPASAGPTPEAPATDTLRGLTDTVAAPDTATAAGPDSTATPTADSTATPTPLPDSIPGDTIPVSPDSIPDGAEPVPTPRGPGLPHQE